MALFWAAFKRDSVSFLRFFFLNHVLVFSCKMSLVSRLKRPYSCFSSHFCFLVIVVQLSLVLFLVAAVSLPPHFCMKSLSLCIDASSSLVHFKNSPQYLIRGTALVFIPLIKFLL